MQDLHRYLLQQHVQKHVPVEPGLRDRGDDVDVVLGLKRMQQRRFLEPQLRHNRDVVANALVALHRNLGAFVAHHALDIHARLLVVLALALVFVFGFGLGLVIALSRRAQRPAATHAVDCSAVPAKDHALSLVLHAHHAFLFFLDLLQ